MVKKWHNPPPNQISSRHVVASSLSVSSPCDCAVTQWDGSACDKAETLWSACILGLACSCSWPLLCEHTCASLLQDVMCGVELPQLSQISLSQAGQLMPGHTKEASQKQHGCPQDPQPRLASWSCDLCSHTGALC